MAKPDLTIYLGEFQFNPLEAKHDYMYYEHRRQVIFRTKFLLEEMQGETKMMYTSPRWKLFKRIRRPIADLISALMLIKLLQKGYSFIHAACLERKGRGILIIAPPETGKTSVVLSLVKQGFAYLADDVCIIDGLHAYSWPRALTLHLGHIKPYGVKLNFGERVSLLARELLSTMPFLKLTEEMRVEPERLFKDPQTIKRDVRIERVYLLRLGSDSISEIDKDLALRIATICNELCPLRINVDYVLNYAYEYPDVLNLDEYAELSREIRRKTFETISCFEVRCKDKRFDRLILKHVKSGL